MCKKINKNEQLYDRKLVAGTIFVGHVSTVEAKDQNGSKCLENNYQFRDFLPSGSMTDT